VRHLVPIAFSVLVTACGPVRRTDGGVGLLPLRSTAPEFSAPDQTGRVRALAEFKGRAVVLYFYPRDATPGCTREACAFRDAWSKLEKTGAQVLGVSTDDVASHARFASEHQLPFPILADPEKKILRAYGVDSTLGLSSRVTFVIDRAGVVAKVYPDVDPGVHASEVIAVLEALK
jgi:peroxiredoxin Q/BCP